MGSEVDWPDASRPRLLRAQVIGTAPVSSCVVVKNNADIFEARSAGETLSFEHEDTTPAAPGDFYYLRITQADGQMAWVSPIFIN